MTSECAAQKRQPQDNKKSRCRLSCSRRWWLPFIVSVSRLINTPLCILSRLSAVRLLVVDLANRLQTLHCPCWYSLHKKNYVFTTISWQKDTAVWQLLTLMIAIIMTQIRGRRAEQKKDEPSTANIIINSSIWIHNVSSSAALPSLPVFCDAFSWVAPFVGCPCFPARFPTAAQADTVGSVGPRELAKTQQMAPRLVGFLLLFLPLPCRCLAAALPLMPLCQNRILRIRNVFARDIFWSDWRGTWIRNSCESPNNVRLIKFKAALFSILAGLLNCSQYVLRNTSHLVPIFCFNPPQGKPQLLKTVPEELHHQLNGEDVLIAQDRNLGVGTRFWR